MTTSCIIPFYNEYPRILSVLKVVTSVKNIDEIVCVDDGSTDKSAQYIKKEFPNVVVVTHPVNKGKAAAVKTGLAHTTGSHILLFDADMRYLRAKEIEHILSLGKRNDFDMILLKGNRSFWLTHLAGHDILLTGKRIVKRRDLVEMFREEDPSHFQIEVAMNYYMLRHHKKIGVFGIFAENTYKIYKQGIVSGLKTDIQMMLSIIGYRGIFAYLKHWMAFPYEEIKQ